uniref:Beta-catenin-like protein 1 n=1 Tax=Nothoprocta perdicaria TaxID=30464 RepID=A0A8C6Z3S3_NOTPE
MGVYCGQRDSQSRKVGSSPRKYFGNRVGGALDLGRLWPLRGTKRPRDEEEEEIKARRKQASAREHSRHREEEATVLDETEEEKKKLIQIMERDGEEEDEEEEPLDESSVKKMILTFEKRSYKNQELRIKFPDNPEKFMESELDLNDIIQEMHVIATMPDLYHLLVELNAVQSLLGLLGHDNTDILDRINVWQVVFSCPLNNALACFEECAVSPLSCIPAPG